MLKQALLALALLPAAAFANVEDDITRIRPLLPAGTDVAQIQNLVIRGTDPREAIQAGASNYVLRDLNGDGLEDLLVISEEAPHFEKYNSQESCSSEDEPDCMLMYGKRELHFFLGQRDGSFKKQFTNSKLVRGADEGGVFGDPLNGFTVRKNGTIRYDIYGGSSWRWSFGDIIQFRNGDLHVIGQESYTGWTGDLRSDTKSVNLITGEVKETHQKNYDAPVRTKRYRVKVKALPKLATYTGQMD